MEKDLLLVFDDINKKVNKIYTGSKKERYNKQIEVLKQNYQAIDITERHMPTYESLVSKGKELLRDANIRDEKKVSYYLRYCGAAEYDFKDNIKPLNTIMKSYLLTCTLFFVLAPQYFGVVLPLIFVVPIFMGLRGMRKRVLNGLMISISIVPMGILSGLIWIRNAYIARGSFDVFISNIAQSYNLPVDFTQNLAIACIAMSAVIIGSSITLFVTAIKHRRMFI